jgi:hypothetical protein
VEVTAVTVAEEVETAEEVGAATDTPLHNFVYSCFTSTSSRRSLGPLTATSRTLPTPGA